MPKTVLVCGSRTFSDHQIIWSVLDRLMAAEPFSYLITGDCRSGADVWARAWCAENDSLYIGFPADWAQYGKRAGYLRNAKMLEEGKPDLVLAFFDDSPCVGTHMMCTLAEDAGVEVRHITVGE